MNKSCGACRFFIKWRNDKTGGGLCEKIDARTKTDLRSECKYFKRKRYLRKPKLKQIITSAKLDVCPDCGAEFQIDCGSMTSGSTIFMIEIEYCPECGFIKNTTATKQKGIKIDRI